MHADHGFNFGKTELKQTFSGDGSSIATKGTPRMKPSNERELDQISWDITWSDPIHTRPT